jgi:hypothetical protein
VVLLPTNPPMSEKNARIGAVKKTEYRQNNRRRLKFTLKRMLAENLSSAHGLSLNRVSIRHLVE